MALFAKNNDLRCPVCMNEWNQKAEMAKGNRGCPFCKTSLQPLRIIEDGYVKLNWQDLRVLAIYASRWSLQFDLRKKGNVDAIVALQNILEKLKGHKPASGLPLLPLQEIIKVEMVHEKSPRKIDLVLDETRDMKPDKDGKILSPFYQRNNPPTQ